MPETPPPDEDLTEDAQQTEDLTPASSELATEARSHVFARINALTRGDFLVGQLLHDGTLQPEDEALARDILSQHGEETFFCFLQAREELQARTATAQLSPRYKTSGRSSIY